MYYASTIIFTLAFYFGRKNFKEMCPNYILLFFHLMVTSPYYYMEIRKIALTTESEVLAIKS